MGGVLREAYGNFEGHVEGVGRYERDENVAVKIFAFGNACNQAHFSDGVGQSGQQHRGGQTKKLALQHTPNLQSRKILRRFHKKVVPVPSRCDAGVHPSDFPQLPANPKATLFLQKLRRNQ